MKTFTVNRLSPRPDYPLPFYPRGAGVNYFNKGFKEDLPPMDFTELCWVQKGCCIIDAYGEKLTLAAGQAVFRMPHEVRRKFIIKGPAEIWWATIDGPDAENFVRSFGYPQGVLSPGRCPVELFERIARGLLPERRETTLSLLPVFVELFIRAGRHLKPPEKTSNIAGEALYRLHTDYSDPNFNINTLAEQTGVHRTTLDRILHRETGKLPLEILTEIRLNHSCELLLATTLPVSGISRLCGYRNCNYFCRLFRQKKGVTPQQFRQKSGITFSA